ncbi:hypothetical protein FXO37_22356 [Capsicum annuum]|nr:hypothetical protein FXO37_22356 [Capsicum annuum]
MVDALDDSNIMEEREELMVSLVDEQVKPIFRVAHFFKPTIPSTKKLPFLPSRSKLSSCSSLKVKFRGGPSYMRGWSKWVSELKPLHQEDIVVLGGYSVLGQCVLEPVKTNDSVEVEKNLCEAYKVVKESDKNVSPHPWMEHFAGRGDNLEHVAFLTLWLSRDLNLLKQLIVSSSKNAEKSSYSRCVEDDSDLILRAPLHFVQLWAWERFTSLQPKPSTVIYTGEPRVARWHKVKKLNCVDPRSEIDSASEHFLWRPYAVDIVKNWDINKFYKERDEYVYNPHRVSMQFGFDQDAPGCVNLAGDHTPKIAWTNYNRPIKDVKLYIPSRFIESDVSRRYLDWWKDQNVAPEDADQHVVKGKLSRTHDKINAFVSCEFLQKCDKVREDGNSPDCEMRVLESSDDDDNILIAESLCRRKLMKKEITIPSNQSQASSTSNVGTARERETLTESNPISENTDGSNGKPDEDGDGPYAVKEMVPPSSTEKNTDRENDRNESNSNTTHNLVIVEQKGGERTSCDGLIMDIELRLSRLERLAASRRRC